MVLSIFTIIYIFYWRRKQKPEECSSGDSTCTDIGDSEHDSEHEAEEAFLSFTKVIEEQSNVPTEPITETEVEPITEEILEKYIIDDTSCLPKVPTEPITETELQPVIEEILVEDTVLLTSSQPKRSTGPITTAELHAFTEELIQKDTNNVTPLLRINHQGRTSSRDTNDKAQNPLLTIPSAALKGPTIRAFLRLLNNYDPNVAAREVVSKVEIQENIHFLNEIMKTQVMKHTEQFLKTRGIIHRPLKDVLKEIWFTMYSRAGRSYGSSGFEHVFIGEIKNEKVSGFHNWIQFGHEEWDGDLDYKGIMRYVNLGHRGQVIKGRFEWMNESKPVGTLFVGTSPEFEMALYTVCFLVKPNEKCQVKLNNKKFNIQTHSLAWNDKLIGGAFPDI